MSGDAPPGVWKATAVSLLVAVLVLVTVVLPAEYGIDPLGTGEVLGVLGLSREPPGAVTGQTEDLRVDAVRYELAPFESVEYKYRLEAGASLQFDWSATGEVTFDLHAEPDGAEPGFAESFAQGRGTGARGTYVAPFAGIHGWFWENRGVETVTVELSTSGFYPVAKEYRDGWQTDREPDQIRARVEP